MVENIFINLVRKILLNLFSLSLPWLYYHIINSFDLLNAEAVDIYDQVVSCLRACHSIFGGYCGNTFEVFIKNQFNVFSILI